MKDTIESVTGFIKELIDESRARASSRWFANLAITFLFFNWKNIVEGVIPIKPHTAASIITLVESMFCGHSCWWYVALVLVWAFWVFGKPAVDTGMNYAQHKIKQWVRFKKVEATITRENRDFEEYYRNLQTIESDLKKEVQELREELVTSEATLSHFKLEAMTTSKTPRSNLSHFIKCLGMALNHEISKQHDRTETTHERIGHTQMNNKMKALIYELTEISNTYDSEIGTKVVKETK